MKSGERILSPNYSIIVEYIMKLDDGRNKVAIERKDGVTQTFSLTDNALETLIKDGIVLNEKSKDS